MTQEQKKQAAMELCRLQGVDPEEKLGGMVYWQYAWQIALKKIEHHESLSNAQEQLETAMQFGRDYKE